MNQTLPVNMLSCPNSERGGGGAGGAGEGGGGAAAAAAEEEEEEEEEGGGRRRRRRERQSNKENVADELRPNAFSSQRCCSLSEQLPKPFRFNYPVIFIISHIILISDFIQIGFHYHIKIFRPLITF